MSRNTESEDWGYAWMGAGCIIGIWDALGPTGRWIVLGVFVALAVLGSIFGDEESDYYAPPEQQEATSASNALASTGNSTQQSVGITGTNNKGALGQTNKAFPPGVEFPDPAFAQGIRDHLGIPEGQPITKENLLSLTDITLHDRQISDISGIDNLANLERFQLSENQIRDISPLSELKNLHNIHLGGNPITDVSPLASLTNLQTLSLNEVAIKDLSPLANLTNLVRLDVGIYEDRWGFPDNKITDISPLQSLVNLNFLNLVGHSVEDISVLSSLTLLESLTIPKNVEDISVIGNLQQLSMLEIRGNQVRDISVLESLNNLLYLTVDENVSNSETIARLKTKGVQVKVTSLVGQTPDSTQPTNLSLSFVFPDPVLDEAVRAALKKTNGEPITTQDLLSLKILYQSNQDENQEGIVDLTGIEKCLNLEQLAFDGNSIADITPIKSLTKLEYFSVALNGGHLSDITPIESLTNLRTLSLGDTDLIQDFTPIQNLTNLQTLVLSRTGIEDLTVLSGLSNLVHLSLANNIWSSRRSSADNHNKIRDISPLATLKNLDGLNIEVNLVEDISPIASLTKLRSFVATANQITDLAPITSTNLDSVGLSKNRIADLSPLRAYGSLDGTTGPYSLDLADNQIADLSALDSLLESDGSNSARHKGQIILSGNPINDEGRNLIRKWQSLDIDIIFE